MRSFEILENHFENSKVRTIILSCTDCNMSLTIKFKILKFFKLLRYFYCENFQTSSNHLLFYTCDIDHFQFYIFSVPFEKIPFIYIFFCERYKKLRFRVHNFLVRKFHSLKILKYNNYYSEFMKLASIESTIVANKEGYTFLQNYFYPKLFSKIIIVNFCFTLVYMWNHKYSVQMLKFRKNDNVKNNT